MHVYQGTVYKSVQHYALTYTLKLHLYSLAKTTPRTKTPLLPAAYQAMQTSLYFMCPLHATAVYVTPLMYVLNSCVARGTRNTVMCAWHDRQLVIAVFLVCGVIFPDGAGVCH